jgi:hypothetical protein
VFFALFANEFSITGANEFAITGANEFAITGANEFANTGANEFANTLGGICSQIRWLLFRDVQLLKRLFSALRYNANHVIAHRGL